MGCEKLPVVAVGRPDTPNYLITPINQGFGGLVFEGDNRRLHDLQSLVDNRTDARLKA